MEELHDIYYIEELQLIREALSRKISGSLLPQGNIFNEVTLLHNQFTAARPFAMSRYIKFMEKITTRQDRVNSIFNNFSRNILISSLQSYLDEERTSLTQGKRILLTQLISEFSNQEELDVDDFMDHYFDGELGGS